MPDEQRAAWHALLAAVGFDGRDYVERHPDLPGAGLTPSEAPDHFLTWGVHEGREIRFTAELETALASSRRSALSERERVAFGQVLGASRVAEAGFDGTRPALLADALVATDAFRPLLLIGDSHVRLYNDLGLLQPDGGGWLPVPLTCWAGSARGLRNPNARAGYGPRILAFIEAHERRLAASHAVVLLKFGQVDVEFVYNFKRVAREDLRAFRPLDYLDFVIETAKAYAEFLDTVRGLLPARVPMVVAGVFPPTLSDEAMRRSYVVAHVAELEDAGEADALAEAMRSLEMPDWRVRTLFHVLFNRELRARAHDLGVHFLDDLHPFIGPGGVVADRFIVAHGGTDHHLGHCDATRATIRALGHDLRSMVGDAGAPTPPHTHTANG